MIGRTLLDCSQLLREMKMASTIVSTVSYRFSSCAHLIFLQKTSEKNGEQRKILYSTYKWSDLTSYLWSLFLPIWRRWKIAARRQPNTSGKCAKRWSDQTYSSTTRLLVEIYATCSSFGTNAGRRHHTYTPLRHALLMRHTNANGRRHERRSSWPSIVHRMTQRWKYIRMYFPSHHRARQYGSRRGCRFSLRR